MNNSEIKTNLNKILKSGKNFLDLPVCIDFYVDWDQTSFDFVQIVDNVKSKYEDKIFFISVDVDKEPIIASKFGITTTPRMILIPKDGTPQIKNAPLNTETFEYYLDGMILDSIVFDEDELIEDEPVVKEYPPAQLMIDSTVEETVDEVVSNTPPPIEEPTVSTKKARPTRPNQKKPNVPNEVIPKQKKRGGFFNRQKNKK